MFVSKVKLWNFRKYGRKGSIDTTCPHLEVPLNEGMNILIGENDSGKSAIIDAIKLVLKTHAYEWIRLEEDDFYIHTDGTKANELRIELEFSDITDQEAANFIEWCGWREEDIPNEIGKLQNKQQLVLILIYKAYYRENKIISGDVRAGMDGEGLTLPSEVKELLKCTYLKPLRDADSELTARKNSRLSQILKEHKAFKKQSLDKHDFEKHFSTASKNIRVDFENPEKPYNKEIKEVIEQFIKDFIDESYSVKFDLGDTELISILEKLSLGISHSSNPGLGTMNRLFMAAELLHLRKDNHSGLKLCMIEELEAHLHPQAQLKIINRLKKENIQFILTTHSPNITSQAHLRDIIICKNNKVYPLGEQYTKLDKNNYKYLERFLDVTKSNLFFSKGNIIVEGWSEEIILPILAQKLGYDLTKNEISIINVGSTAYLHFAKIFLRADNEKMDVPVSIVTDLDNRPDDNGNFDQSERNQLREESINTLKKEFDKTKIELFTPEEWTLEWCLYKSCLKDLFKKAVKIIHSRTEGFKEGNDGLFEATLIKKLKKTEKSALDKVAVANEFSILLNDDSSVTSKKLETDEYLKYLVLAIKHVIPNVNQ